MKGETPQYDFSKGERGKFFREGAKLNLPVYLDDEVRAYFQERARAKGVEFTGAAGGGPGLALGRHISAVLASPSKEAGRMVNVMQGKEPVSALKLSRTDRQRLEDFCRRWQIRELDLFGSAVRDELRPESDLDFLVTFSDEARWTLWDHVQMEEELSEIVGREVDLVTRRAIERSTNWIRRDRILGEARLVYAA